MRVSKSPISCTLQHVLFTIHFYSFCLWYITHIYSLTTLTPYFHSIFPLNQFLISFCSFFFFSSVLYKFFLLPYFFLRRPGTEFNGCRHCYHFWQVRTYDRSSWSLSMFLIWMDLHILIDSSAYYFFLHYLFHLSIYKSFILLLPSCLLHQRLESSKWSAGPSPGPSDRSNQSCQCV